VRQLIDRVISPNSLFSVGVPMSQLEAESPTALAIGELLSADCCQVFAVGDGEAKLRPVSLDEWAREAAREHVGMQGSRFLNLTLDVRGAEDAAAPSGEERRQGPLPETVEVQGGQPTGVQSAPAEGQAPAPSGQQAEALPVAENGILAIVAEPLKEEPAEAAHRKEYVRKSDWLRAQFLPEVEALDFSGLFVGNLGLGIREKPGRRTVLMADPSRITDLLLKANGYRRSGDHAKALICYQELVDVDPANADFRFLLGKTLIALGQQEEAAEAFVRAKELGHEGAGKELEQLARSGHRSRSPLGFLRFWKQ